MGKGSATVEGARAPRRGMVIWGGALALALGFLAVDSAARLETVRRISEGRASDLALPAVDAGSPSGYRGSQHRLILPDVDGYHWIMQIEQMLGRGDLRVRDFFRDNAPDGREVHWAAPLRWWGAGVAWAYRALHRDLSWPLALERVVPWANTLLFAILLVSLTPLMAWRLGHAPAALFALGSVTVFPLYEYFAVGEFDHHGVATMSCVAAVLFLVIGGGGWVRLDTIGARDTRVSYPDERAARGWLPAPPEARRWFIASAALAGVGLWISAATAIPVLLGVGAGALLLSFEPEVARAPHPSWRIEPTLWRTWGMAGGAASLLFYLLEYFPGHLGLRLEVNHPVYALAWVGAGDLLCRCAQRRVSPRSMVPLWILFDAVLVLLPLGVILVSTGSAFRPADDFLLALHVQSIAEFRPLARGLEGMTPTQVIAHAGAVPLVSLLGAAFLWPTTLMGPARWGWRLPSIILLLSGMAFTHTVAQALSGSSAPALVLDAFVFGLLFVLPLSARVPPLASPWRSALGLVSTPAAFFMGLSLTQMRWLGASSALWLAALAVMAGTLTMGSSGVAWTVARKTVAASLVLAVMAPFPLYSLALARSSRTDDATDVRQLIERDAADWLRRRLGDEQGVVFASPNATTSVMYFGGLRGLGTLYWENLQGLEATAAIYGAPTSEEARALLARHGVTHFVAFAWDAGLEDYRIARGADGGGNAFLPSILQQPDPSALPPWLVALPYVPPRTSVAPHPAVRIFEVVPEDPAEVALVRSARYFEAMEQGATAEQALRASLALSPRPEALALLARIQRMGAVAGDFSGTIEILRESLSTHVPLDLEGRLDVATAFALANDLEQTRGHLTAALSLADEPALRRLPLPALSLLVDLSARLGLTPGHEEVLAIARSLLPLAPPR